MSRKTLTVMTAAVVMVLAGFSKPAAATSLTWDPGGSGGSDGSGNWLDPGVWWDGSANVDWNNSTPDDAIIGSSGAGGTITLGTVSAGTVLLDNFTGTYTLQSGSLDQSGGITIGANAGNVTLKLPVSGTGGLTVNGPVRVNLKDGGAKTFSGDLVINAGEVLDHAWDDLGTGNLVINGGVLVGYWGDQMTRSLGAGPGQVQLPGGVSGFCGQGRNGATIKLNNDTTTPIQWGSTYFNPSTLVLQSPWANLDGKLTFQNAVDLNGAQRTIAVNKDHQGQNGYARVDGLLSNSAGTPAGITKTGPGRLILTNTNNSYDGPTIVNEGVLELGTGWQNAQSIPGGISNNNDTGSNLELNGGTVTLWYYLKRNVGSGPGQFQITGGASGFNIGQADTYGRLYLNNDTSTTIVWGSPSFNPDVLVFNEDTSSTNQVVNFQNKLDLNGADRTVATNSTRAVPSNYVNQHNGYMTTTGGRITGDISNSGGTPAGLIKTGPGHLQLTGTNTYDGGTTINQGKLQFTQLVSMPATGNVAVNDGATLVVNVGGPGEWTAGASGNGTIGGLLAGLGGQSGSTVSYSGNVTVGFVPSGSQTYTGVVSDVGTSLGIDQAGSGTLELAGNNTYSGDTKVTGGGTLILSGDNSGAAGDMRISNGYLNVGENGAGLTAGKVMFESSGSNPAILMASGTLDVTTGSSGDVYWSGAAGGFAATDSALTVTLNGGADAAWRGNTGFGGDNKPQMGSPTSAAPVTITNNFTIGYHSSIRLFDNPATSADVSIFSGNIVYPANKNYTLQVNGTGTLWLQGNNDFQSGTLQINDNAVVRAVDGVGLSNNAKLMFNGYNGGIFESSGNFTRTIGNASGKVYWNNRGGFAAWGGSLTVTLERGDGQALPLDWGDSNNGFRGRDLQMGSPTANDVVTLTNDIDGGGGNRNIYVWGNPDTDADYAVLSGELTNFNTLYVRGGSTSPGKLLVANVTANEVQVLQGATLGGSGNIFGQLTVASGSGVAPGASVGTMTAWDNVALNTGSFYEWEVGQSGQTDVLHITAGTLNLDDFVLKILDADGFVASDTDPLPVFTYVPGSVTVDMADFGNDADNFDTSALGPSWTIGTLALTDDLAGTIYLTGLSGGSGLIPGDFNRDAQVEQTDLNLLLQNWGASSVPPEWTAAFDGLVDQNELNDLLQNWGAGVSGAGTAGATETVAPLVPEPATLSLLVLSGLAACRRRR